MKTFSIKHRIIKYLEQENFSEDNPPKWMIHKEYKWWYTGHVLTLKVGDSIKTDFQEITRLS